MLCEHLQALQAPACHENLVKVGGYILGEFGNLIAGDSRSRYTQHLHSAIHCSEKCLHEPQLRSYIFSYIFLTFIKCYSAN